MRESAAFLIPGFQEKIETSKQKADFIPTGFPSLDKLLDDGLYAGLYIVGAISSLGKTTFCLQIADQVAQSGHDVLIFSLEMPKEDLIAKSISRLTYIKTLQQNISQESAKTTKGILTGKRYVHYTQEEIDLINSSINEYSNYGINIYIIEGVGDVGVANIRDVTERHIQMTGNAPLIIIDYLQILAPADFRATDKQSTDRAVLELKRLSRDFSVPVIGISSFNRDNYSSPVNLTSFKESGAIEYSSDVLIGLQYKGMDYIEGEADKAREKRIRSFMVDIIEAGKSGRPQPIQLKVLKNRNGTKGEVNFDFYPMFNYFAESKTNSKEEKEQRVPAKSKYPY